MAKSLILRNENASSVIIDDLGIFVSASSSLNITQLTSAERFAVYASQNLRTKLTAEELILNDGSSDIAVVDIDDFLQRFCVLEHHLEDDHSGNLPETRITDGGILARLGDDETVTGDWEFTGGIKVEVGATLPATPPSEGHLFYKNTAPKALYVSNGTDWVSFADADDFDPTTGHDHDGTNSKKVDHEDLANVLPDQHHSRKHDLDSIDDHEGTLSESKIANGSLLARVADDETITGTYNFSSGGLIVETGATIPSGTIAVGRIFWHNTGDPATRALYIGNGSTWVEMAKTSDFDAHDHDGINSPQVDHNDLTNKGTNSHSTIDAHLAATSNPHGSVMTVTGRINTPEIRGTGSDLVLDAASSSPTTIFLKNSGGGTFNVRVMGTLNVDGPVNSTGTTELLVEDNKIVLNSNYAGNAPDTNASLEVERGIADDNAIVLWNESLSTPRWQAGVGTNLKTFAYSDADESVTGNWDFQGSLIIPYDGSLPASAPEGGIFWKTGTTDELYMGNGTTWQKLLSEATFSDHTHDGVDSHTVSHNDLDNVTTDNHHAKLHALSDNTHHIATNEADKLPEAWIQNQGLLARVADNEAITGSWSFAGGSLVIPAGTSLPGSNFTDGRLFWKSDTDTLYAGDGTTLVAIAKKNGILSVSPGLALSNNGTTQASVLDVGVDDTSIEITGAVAGSGGTLKIKAVTESVITNGSILARVADPETITGNWEFNGTLTIPTLAGSTLPTGTIPNGRVLQLEGTDDLYIGNGATWTKVLTEANISASIRCRVQLSRGGSLPAGTFLNDGGVVTGLATGVPVASACKLVAASFINDSTINDGSGIEIFKNGTAVGTLNVPAGQNKGTNAALNVSLVAGDFLSVRAKTTNGSNLKNPHVVLELS